MKRQRFFAQHIRLSYIIFLTIATSFGGFTGCRVTYDIEKMLFEDKLIVAPDKKILRGPRKHEKKPQRPTKKTKKWTFIVYIAADNDLRSFAARNIRQMAHIGSSENINVLVHLDIRLAGNKKVTRRYYVDQNKIIHMNANDPHSQKMDSGDPQTLVSCCKWAIENYPAHDYALILWNHGTGILDPERGRIINPTQLFSFNSITKKLELDRSVGFLDLIANRSIDEDTGEPRPGRGICWDDTTHHYLSNGKLHNALRTVSKKYLNGKKFSIIGFDACLMSMLEVGSQVKEYAHIMVGSQEVEYGTGWDYSRVLAPFKKYAPTKEEFAQHIVHVYEQTYQPITNDFTQSAIDLDELYVLEENIHKLGRLLAKAIKAQKNNSVRNAIKTSRNKFQCVHFDEPRYIDLHDLYRNLLKNIKLFNFKNVAEGNNLKQRIATQLKQGKKIIKHLVLANTAGKNLRRARGISIYFPEYKIHVSYPRSKFGSENYWIEFLSQYLRR